MDGVFEIVMQNLLAES